MVHYQISNIRNIQHPILGSAYICDIKELLTDTNTVEYEAFITVKAYKYMTSSESRTIHSNDIGVINILNQGETINILYHVDEQPFIDQFIDKDTFIKIGH